MARSLEAEKRGEYERVGSLELQPGTLLVVKQVFENEEDGSEGVLYLVSSDLTLDYERLTAIYQRRRKVEEYHKSLKSNASLAESPTKTKELRATTASRRSTHLWNWSG